MEGITIFIISKIFMRKNIIVTFKGRNCYFQLLLVLILINMNLYVYVFNSSTINAYD